MTIEIISEDGYPDFEIWTCDSCGHKICLSGTGGDVAECPKCIEREYAAEASA